MFFFFEKRFTLLIFLIQAPIDTLYCCVFQFILNCNCLNFELNFSASTGSYWNWQAINAYDLKSKRNFALMFYCSFSIFLSCATQSTMLLLLLLSTPKKKRWKKSWALLGWMRNFHFKFVIVRHVMNSI